MKNKLQALQNKCIRFCLKLDSRSHISDNEFKDINWLPVAKRIEQCIDVSVFKYMNNDCPSYMSEIYEAAPQTNLNLRNNFLKLKHPFRKTNIGQKALSYIGPTFWNSLPNECKKITNCNSFKHKLKDSFLNIV